MTDGRTSLDAYYIQSIQSAIVSIPFAIMAAPLFEDDNAAFYFVFISISFVLYSFISLLRAGRHRNSV